MALLTIGFKMIKKYSLHLVINDATGEALCG